MHIPPGLRTPLRGARCLSLILALGAAWLLALPAAQAADPAPAPAAAPAAPPVQVRVTTNMGDFVIEVLTDRSPLTARNFLRYVSEGFYSGTLIHRVVSNFVIQGGGYYVPQGGKYEAGDYKLKDAHEPIFNESGNGEQNKRGTVGLARSANPHSGNCQIYINLVDNPDLDPLPTRWGYAVFGKVVSGMDVIDRMGTVATGQVGATFKQDAPVKPIVIQKMEIMGGPATPAAKPQTDTTSPK
jgi:cyclophilin family peptidyl-prolyl cis-trans isomerase